MGVNRIVNTDFWIDSKVIDLYSPEDKYFWLYLLTNPQSKQLGIYKLPQKLIAFQLGYSLDTVQVLLERFENKYQAIIYSYETQEIAILNYLKYSIVKGGKPVIDCIAKDISEVKNTTLLNIIREKVIAFNDTRPTMQTIMEMLPNDNDNDNDNDSNAQRYGTRIVKPKKSNKFIPPTIEEVQAYCKERNNHVDAERFVDFYTSKGWMVGKSKMKDWKAAVRNWEKNSKPDTSSNPFKEMLRKELEDEQTRSNGNYDDYKSGIPKLL